MNWIYILVIAVLFILVLLIILNTDNENNNYVETIVYMSTRSSRPLDSIRDAVLYTKMKPTFIAFTETTALDINDVIHIGSSKAVTNNNFYTGANNLNNFKSAYIGGYEELQYLDNYLGCDSYYYITQNYFIFTGENMDIILCQLLMNKFTNHILYFFVFKNTYDDSYFSDRNNTSTFAIFTKIKSIADNNSFIVTGNTNIIGWELIAKYVFGDTVYCSGDLQLPTVNDENGLASPDAIIVSKNYCTRLDIIITFSPFTLNIKHFLLCVKIYKGKSSKKGFVISDNNKKMLQYYIKNIHNLNFINMYKPSWDPSKHIIDDLTTYWVDTNVFSNQKPLIALEDLLTNINK